MIYPVDSVIQPLNNWGLDGERERGAVRVKAGAPSWTVGSGAKRTNDKVTVPPIRGVSNDLCEYLRACERCVYFL